MARGQGIELMEDDVLGKGTLNAINKAENFNLWMFDTIRPFLKGKVLEIGSGIGNISQFLIQNKNDCFLSDIREGYCEILRQKFEGSRQFIGVEPIDFADPDFEGRYPHHVETYDSAFALNVVEHIQNDVLALINCRRVLKKGGVMVALVPSYQSIFNRFDTKLGHCRRYTTGSMSDAFREAGFEVIHTRYFNFLGIFGWILFGGILKRKAIQEGPMRLYNKMVPLAKLMDKAVFRSVGLSTIVVGRKK